MDTRRLRVRATAATVGTSAVCAIEIHSGSTSSLFLDWLAAQVCGFCLRPEVKPQCLALAEGQLSSVSSSSGHGGTSVEDETTLPGALPHCILTSSPQVVGYAIALRPGETRTFVVSCEMPCELPPSFDGSLVCVEYALLLTMRSMTAPSKSSGWLSSWLSDGRDADGDECTDVLASSGSWPRGPQCRIRLPLHLEACSSWLRDKQQRALPGKPARCELTVGEEQDGEEAVAAATTLGEEHKEQEAEAARGEGDSDVSEDEDDHLGRCFQLRVSVSASERLLASCELSSARLCVGGAVRGVLSLGPPAGQVSRIRVSLVIEEAASEAAGQAAAQAAGQAAGQAASTAALVPSASASHVVVAKMDISRSPATLQSSFELPIPSYLPPNATLHVNDARVPGGMDIELRWALRITLELAAPHGGSMAEGAAAAAERVPWRIPLHVLPIARPRCRPAMARVRALRMVVSPRSGRGQEEQKMLGPLAAPSFTPLASAQMYVA